MDVRQAATLGRWLLVAVPAAFVLTSAATVVYYEKVWLPRIAGED